MYKNKLLLLLFIVLFTSSVRATKDKMYWSDCAAYVAGLPVSVDSPFVKLTKRRYYRFHKKFMKSFWHKVKRSNIKLIKKWSQTHLSTKGSKNRAFYPLSGGDFINLYTFFPLAKDFTMFALEKPGNIPNFLKMSHRQLRHYLYSLRGVIGSIANKNYFYSAAMRQHMKSNGLKGVAPVIMTFSAGLGLKITNVEYYDLNASGSLSKTEFDKNTDAVVFSFTSQEVQTERKITYLSFLVEYDSMDFSTPTGKFFNNYYKVNTMMKSAIYLLHHEEYSRVADFVATRSDFVLQDDSGMALKLFTDGNWNIELYGAYKTYTIPIRGIGYPPKQLDLIKMYRDERKAIEPLRFRFGYGGLIGKRKSTLMLLTRKELSNSSFIRQLK